MSSIEDLRTQYFLSQSIDDLNNNYINNISSLDVKYKFSFIDKCINAIKFLRMNGIPEMDILEKIKTEMQKRDYDIFSIRKVYQKSFGRPLEDDFLPENIVKEREFGYNIVSITVKVPIEGVQIGSLVQYRDTDWKVIGIKDLTYILKRISTE